MQRRSFTDATRTLPMLTVVLAVAGLAGCHTPPPLPPAPADLAPVSVNVTALELREDAQVLLAVGRVKNVRESNVAGRLMGRVIEVRVKSGDRVKQGDVLLRIDSRDARGQVEQARGALAQAKAARTIGKQQLDRFEALKAKDAASQARYDKTVFDFESARGAVSQANGALRTAEAYLKDATIVAPFDGVVVDTLIELGELASPGVPLIRLEGEAALEFEALVNGQDIEDIEVGHKAPIFVDANRSEAREVEGLVTEIVPTADRVTHNSLVRLHIEGEHDWLRSGMFGRARFQRRGGDTPTLLVPADHVVRRGQLEAVYVLDPDNRVRLRLVKSGRSLGHELEILAGLEAGDRLVISPPAGLVDGQPGVGSASPAAAEQ